MYSEHEILSVQKRKNLAKTTNMQTELTYAEQPIRIILRVGEALLIT